MVRVGKKGQTWSVDLIIAVIVFIAVVASFYAFLSSSGREDQAVVLQDTAKTIGRQLNCDVATESGTCFVSKGRINEQELDTLSGLDYDALKDQLGIEDDFCIYIKDIDGNLVPIPNTGAGQNLSGLGSNTLILSSGIRCNTPI